MIRIDFRRTSMVRYITLGLIFVMAFAFVACDATSNPSEVNPSESPSVTTGATSGEPTGTPGTESTGKPTNTGNPEISDEPFITPTGTAQTAEPTDSTVEPTTVPTPTPTAVAQPTADPAIYNDDWGYSMDSNNTVRSNGEELVWTKTRHLVKIPEELRNRGVYLIDAENEQAFITTGVFGKTLTYYALRDGVFYKLNQGKIVKWNTYMDTYVWVEEDGTACSIGFRSKYWNEVYIEGKECKSIAYRSSTGKFVVVKQSGEIMDVNTEAVLRTATVLN